MAKQSKFPPAGPDSRAMRTGPRSQRQKLLGLIKDNPAFEGFNADESLSDNDLASAMKEHLRGSQSAGPVPRGGLTIDARDEDKE